MSEQDVKWIKEFIVTANTIFDTYFRDNCDENNDDCLLETIDSVFDSNIYVNFPILKDKYLKHFNNAKNNKTIWKYLLEFLFEVYRDNNLSLPEEFNIFSNYTSEHLRCGKLNAYYIYFTHAKGFEILKN